jgi:co-chaperonin GroES (HSP10)
MIEALNTKVTIKKQHKEKTTSSGIVLQHEDNPNPTATIVGVGPDVKSDIKVGDQVFLDWRYVFQLTFHTDENIYITDVSNILAVDKS